jgi:hypothetical protein
MCISFAADLYPVSGKSYPVAELGTIDAQCNASPLEDFNKIQWRQKLWI